jgi:hypothetical protein
LGYILVGKIPEKGGGRGGWKFKNFFCLDRWFRLEGTRELTIIFKKEEKR